jgi:ABC-type transport system involved in multi-copper enzyme maturation permease subunit
VEGIKLLKVTKNDLYKFFTSRKLIILSLIIIAINIFAAYVVNDRMNIEPNPMMMNAQSFPMMMYIQVFSGFFPVFFIFLFAGLISDEVRDGTLKLTLVRPIKRFELINAKIITSIAGILFLNLLVMFSAYLAGLFFWGWGDFFAFESRLLVDYGPFISTLVFFFLNTIGYSIFALIIIFFSNILKNSGFVFGGAMGVWVGMMLVMQLKPTMKEFIPVYYFDLGNFILQGPNTFDFVKGIPVLIAYFLGFYIINSIILQRKEITT